METECNQTNHCTVGAMLVASWKFPETHSTAVQFHHAQSLFGAKTQEAKQVLATVLIAERIGDCGTAVCLLRCSEAV